MNLAEIQNLHKDIESQLSNFDNNPNSLAQINIQIDILIHLNEQTNSLKNSTQALLDITNLENKLAEEELQKTIIKYQEESKNGVNLKSTTQELKNLKRKNNDIKNDIKNTLATIKESHQRIKNKLSSLKKLFICSSKKCEDENLRLERCHHFKPLQFKPFDHNTNYNQHQYMARNPSFNVYPVNNNDAADISDCFNGKTIGVIFEELSLFFGVDESNILIISEGALKYEYNPSITDLLKSLNARYNKEQKSWFVDCTKLGRIRLDKFYSCINAFFSIVVDIDNHLIYTRNDHNLFKIIERRKNFEKINLLEKPYIISKKHNEENNKWDMIQKTTNNNGRISVYNPILKQYEILKKTSLITTRLPTLLFRTSENNTQLFFMIDMLNFNVLNPLIIDKAKKTIYIYRAKLCPLDENDFIHESD